MVLAEPLGVPLGFGDSCSGPCVVLGVCRELAVRASPSTIGRYQSMASCQSRFPWVTLSPTT